MSDQLLTDSHRRKSGGSSTDSKSDTTPLPGKKGGVPRRRGRSNAISDGTPRRRRRANAVSDGSDSEETPGKSEDSKKVESALEAFASADKGAIQAAANAYIKRKDEAKDVDIGHGVLASGKHESAAQAGAWGGAKAIKLENAYAVLVDAGVVVGASIKLEGELKKKFGKFEAKISGGLTAFVGAMAKVSGRAEIGKDGLSATGKVNAFAGAKSKQEGSVELSFGDLGIEAGGEIEEMAGAQFDAEGHLEFSKEEIGMSGEFSAFAGAKVEGSAQASGKLYGRKAITLSTKGSVSAGAGAEGKAGFRIRRGKLQLSVDLSATLGVGLGGGTALDVDFKPIGVFIWRQAGKAYWKTHKKKAAQVLDNPDSAKDDLERAVTKYAREKARLLRTGKSENFVKIEKIQAIVGSVLPRKQVQGHKNAARIDAMIKAAIETSLIAVSGKQGITAEVENGKIKDITGLPEPDEFGGEGNVKSLKTGEDLSSIVETG